MLMMITAEVEDNCIEQSVVAESVGLIYFYVAMTQNFVQQTRLSTFCHVFSVCQDAHSFFRLTVKSPAEKVWVRLKFSIFVAILTDGIG